MKGQGLLVAPPKVILQWQKSPEEPVQEFCSFQTCQLRVTEYSNLQ